MTVVREGRAKYTDSNKPQLLINDMYRNELFDLKGVTISETNQGYEGIIEVMHPTGTDFEHDSSKLVWLDIAGLKYKGMGGESVYFSAVLLAGKWYGDDQDPETMEDDEIGKPYTCDDCNENHLVMRYLPPDQKVKPQPVELELYFGKD